ncbi:jerky protein homolog-like [Homalodisca vitripennis]|uniref:jerky protein homolog-like n=1 Tax=Homalodisca vitripennis TaxID=197043 RepID=UPI001EE9EFAB|nr:jerky protein homolog-like [Homalodisca vitripennis]
MDRALFQEWFEKKQFVPNVRAYNEENGLPDRALLLIDNAPSHPDDLELVIGDIKAIFLPPKRYFDHTTNGPREFYKALKQNYRKKAAPKACLRKNEDLTILQKLKKITIKDVIFWVAEAWENTSVGALQKSWKNLWPDLQFVEEVVPPVNECELLPLVKKIPGCENVEKECVDEWTAVDDKGFEEYTDERHRGTGARSPS